jgi:transaldolase/glucose-6-phosphate isomerase
MLDSTDPDEVRALDSALDIGKTLFIVCSKSGSTLEPNLFMDYFWGRVVDTRGEAEAGKQFVAVTDPGSSLEAVAKDRHFAHIFHGDKSIGGRYSVLSPFGLVAMAAMGLDTERLLAEAVRAMTSCAETVPPRANPGVRLGLALGALATKCKRDKVTVLTCKALASAGAWLEQLIAESTGKNGKALIPVADEPVSLEPVYGEDRVFVYLHLAGTEPPEEALTKLAERGHPVIRLSIEDSYQLGQLFFVWEMAVAVAGSVLGINPFDQPDVESAKLKARELTEKMEAGKPLVPEGAVWKDDSITLYADPETGAHLPRAGSLADCLKAFLAKAKTGDYIALLAYIARNDAHADILRGMRVKLRDAKKLATCVGFGPRFQHSTGQAYKGGPNTGLFLDITAVHVEEVSIPGHTLGFGAVQTAQALGDFDVLVERGRRALRIHLKNTDAGLAQLAKAIGEAVS